MGKSRTLELAVSAIKNLKKIQGSKSKDILNYIQKQFCQKYVDEEAVKKQVQISLKRGVAYGILKRDNEGCYTFPIDTKSASEEIAAQEIGLIKMYCQKRNLAKGGRRKEGGGGGGGGRGEKKGRKRYNENCNRQKCKKSNCKRCGKYCPCVAGNNLKKFHKLYEMAKDYEKSRIRKINSKDNLDKLYFRRIDKKRLQKK